MKLVKYMLPLVVALGFTTATYADQGLQDGSAFDRDLNERDWEALQIFLNSKRTIDVREKAGNLTISGDVRTEWRHIQEKEDGFIVRGSGRYDLGLDTENADLYIPFSEVPLPISKNDFNVEFNLRFDYVTDRSWAVVHLVFDNVMGVNDNGLSDVDPWGFHGSGEQDDVNLKRAYFGYNLCTDGATRFDIEIGRQKLYDIFDSEIQFDSRFDGILAKYSSNLECVADWYWNTGGFVIDERVNQFGFVTELGFLNVMDYGLDFKYSYIFWKKNGKNRFAERDPAGMDFKISQYTLAYHFEPDVFCAAAKLYGAFLWNHGAHKGDYVYAYAFPDYYITDRRDNLGWYVGFTYGGPVVREGDWSVDLEYQWVEARSMPDDEVSGIGRGNAYGTSFTQNFQGNTNYKGWIIQGLYAFTDNISIDASFEMSRAIDKRFGGPHHFSQFELEVVYAF